MTFTSTIKSEKYGHALCKQIPATTQQTPVCLAWLCVGSLAISNLLDIDEGLKQTMRLWFLQSRPVYCRAVKERLEKCGEVSHAWQGSRQDCHASTPSMLPSRACGPDLAPLCTKPWDSSNQILTLGPKVYEYYPLWATWISREECLILVSLVLIWASRQASIFIQHDCWDA